MAITVYSPFATRAPEPSSIRRYYNSLMGSITHDDGSDNLHFEEREGAVHTIVESGATGAALGALHAKLPTGLDIKKAPLDLIGGAIAVAVSGAMHTKVGRSVHAIGDRAVSIYAFRSTAKLLAAKSAVSGDFAADPLRKAAEDL